MTESGLDRITQRVKNLMPISWDALSSDKRVDGSVLTEPVEIAASLLLGAMPSKEEQEALNVLVIDFVAKTAAIELIGSAIDYWMDQKTSITTTGTSETVTYPERIRGLEKLKESLIKDIAKLEPIVTPQLPEVLKRRGDRAPRMSGMDNEEFLTPNPIDFGRPYAEKEGA